MPVYVETYFFNNKSDKGYINKAIRLAKRGKKAYPNPMVGAVVVKDNKIIGQGYHAYFGGPHAEELALEKAGRRARGSTIYTTLEPCVDMPDKKRGSCSDLIIKKGVARVVISSLDPNRKVNGRGVRKLRKAGVEVEVLGIRDGLKINKPFREYQKRSNTQSQKKPYVIISTATTIDGKISTFERKRVNISCPDDFKVRNKLRKTVDAIMIGGRTLLSDNPRLNTINSKGKRVVKVVVVDDLGLIKERADFFEPQTCLKVIFTTGKSNEKLIEKYRRKAKIFILGKSRINLEKALRVLWNLGVEKLMVEGGGETNWQLIKKDLVDEIVLRMNSKVFGGSTAPTLVDGQGFIAKSFKTFDLVDVKRIGKKTVLLKYSKQ